MSDSLLSISAAFGGAYAEVCGAELSLPGIVDSQLQSDQGVGFQR